MPGNRRRSVNPIPLGSVTICLIVSIFATATGLTYVWMKNQMHQSAEQIRMLEQELTTLATQNVVIRTRIDELSAVEPITRQYMADKGKMGGLINIPDDRIVHVGRMKSRTVESKPASELQRIAIQEGGAP